MLVVWWYLLVNWLFDWFVSGILLLWFNSRFIPFTLVGVCVGLAFFVLKLGRLVGL